MRVPFAATARDVNMLVKEARRENHALGINGLKVGEVWIEIWTHGENTFIGHQNVCNTQILRRKDACIFN